ncbi:hypothetical protein CH330_00645, partial [candidate division WOR-3 bacterium JGI_Cruoil_03_51_56]
MNGYQLVKVELKGFRGFPEQGGTQEFKFDEPCTLLLGKQGSGKSSVLCAVEWCFFGDRVARIGDTGIRERKDWLVRNNRSRASIVEVTLKRDEQVLIVYRCNRRLQGRPRFYYQTDGGEFHEDESGLRAVLGIELPDYMSCVHLHQEVISAL